NSGEIGDQALEQGFCHPLPEIRALQQGGVGRVVQVPALDEDLWDRRQVEAAEIRADVDAAVADVGRGGYARARQVRGPQVEAQALRRRHDGLGVACDEGGLDDVESPSADRATVGVAGD